MDGEMVRKSAVFAAISAVLCGIYLAVVLTNDYLSSTLAAVYGSVIFVAIFIVFAVTVWLDENSGVNGCLSLLLVIMLITVALVAVVYCAVNLFIIADASFSKDEMTYELFEAIPNPWIFAMLLAPGICGLASTIGIFLSTTGGDEVSIVWSSLPYVIAYFVCAIISLIFSTTVTMIIIMVIGGLLAGTNVFSIIWLFQAVLESIR